MFLFEALPKMDKNKYSTALQQNIAVVIFIYSSFKTQSGTYCTACFSNFIFRSICNNTAAPLLVYLILSLVNNVVHGFNQG